MAVMSFLLSFMVARPVSATHVILHRAADAARCASACPLCPPAQGLLGCGRDPPRAVSATGEAGTALPGLSFRSSLRVFPRGQARACLRILVDAFRNLMERRMLKKLSVSFLLSLLVVTACSLAGLRPASAQDKTLTVFAAASMKNALDDVDAAYTRKTGIKVVVSYAASSTLIKQIAP